MNSIDETALVAATAALYDALTAGAAALPAEQAPFPMRPDPRLASYYTRRRQYAMTRDDFLSASCVDAGEFGRRLAAWWRAEHPELAGQAALVAEAAAALHALHVQAQPQAELSPCIYQMF